MERTSGDGVALGRRSPKRAERCKQPKQQRFEFGVFRAERFLPWNRSSRFLCVVHRSGSCCAVCPDKKLSQQVPGRQNPSACEAWGGGWGGKRARRAQGSGGRERRRRAVNKTPPGIKINP